MSAEYKKNILKIEALQKRASMLKISRDFFERKNVLEVDCPSITKKPPLDAFIDVMKTDVREDEIGYLHTSPEYCMKRLLAMGIKDIYQLSHVYRKSEKGNFHNPEFTMCEWYRYNISFEDFIDETIEYILLFVKPKVQNILKFSYRELFIKFANVDYVTADFENLKKILEKNNIDVDFKGLDTDDLLNLIMTHIIEPLMQQGTLYAVYNYPATQAALAKKGLDKDSVEVAKRFELYFNQLELANGYDELSNGIEQRKRFEISNEKREQMGKDTYPIDEKFLDALNTGIGKCCGVAVGFDRLLMLMLDKNQIKDVLPFSWEES
jgi:elongation factor P--(R)-beta-lysine ligase